MALPWSLPQTLHQAYRTNAVHQAHNGAVRPSNKITQNSANSDYWSERRASRIYMQGAQQMVVKQRQFELLRQKTAHECET
jgi:hypothetical protein